MEDTHMTHVEEALKLFEQKYHCSQAVFAAFSEEYGIKKEYALKIGGCFGSGMRKGEVCGACTGALMVLGLKYGKSKIDDIESKIRSDKVCDKFLEEFEKENGSYICNTLLGCDISTPERIQYAQDKELFTTFCPKMVESAVKITEKILIEEINTQKKS